ncbi:MAG: CBS domain-containing protein [Chloroflexi bacterium]|nr:CBS domain-containing protein [Chloroflexota bacterium]
MKLVKHVLETKGYNIWSIAPGVSVYDAIELMADKEVGALLVLQDGKLIGIISERDYARKVILKGKSSKETLVRETMTSPVIYTTPNETVEKCMALMTAKHIRHLPVLKDDQLIGVVSIGDLVKVTISEQQVLIQQLEHYILEHTSIT